ncbi:hypothetical protein F2Q68_00019897 [Brassica cretica]|uniref:Uncharacterized protein n=1 Tax=Brassica cretica TaxID=69181 RepID=A0A8S9G273_BRACR|nr:hypothetical protein F2Q68_00019897 [Brassica cretica]
MTSFNNNHGTCRIHQSGDRRGILSIVGVEPFRGPMFTWKEIVLGLPASSAAPLTKTRKRTGAATETVKKRRCTAGAEGEPLGPLSQHRAKFVTLIDGMLSDCRSEIERSTRGLAESREALK